MPAYVSARVLEHSCLRGGYHILRFAPEHGEAHADAAPVPGQFVMLRGEWGRDLINPRAFSVLDWSADGYAVMFKVYGRGTERLANTQVGETLWVTGPLGHGFPSLDELDELGGFHRVFLVAGGVGLPPLAYYGKVMERHRFAANLQLFYGGRNAKDLVLLEQWERQGVSCVLATEDGSAGARGFVTTPLLTALQAAQASGESVAMLACGPTPMLKAVHKLAMAMNVATWLCLEEEMACGFGACLGCAIPVHGEKPYGYCCSDGPVFRAEQVRWS